MRRAFSIVVLATSFVMLVDVAPAAAQLTARERGATPAERPELETDRDAFTPATITVGRQTTVFETSYSFIDNRTVAETHSLPETLLRYGVNDWFELRSGWNYEVGGTGDIVSGNEGGEENKVGGIERESQMLYGAKLSLTAQRGFIPRSATIVQGFTPTSGRAPASDVVVAYTFGWELPNKWRVDSSMRYGTEHAENDVFNQWAPSVIMRVPLTERWNVHAEYFGIYSQGSEREFSRSFFSPGTHYLLTENLEFGVRAGWGLTNDAPAFFTNVGIGWRF